MFEDFYYKYKSKIDKIILYVFIFWMFPILFSILFKTSIALNIFYTHVISIINLIALAKLGDEWK